MTSPREQELVRRWTVSLGLTGGLVIGHFTRSWTPVAVYGAVTAYDSYRLWRCYHQGTVK